MKKVLISICMAFAATTINAQLVVDSLGRVGIGTETPLSQLSLGTDGSDGVTFYCKTNNKTKAIESTNSFNSTAQTIGLSAHARNNLGKCIGVWGEAFCQYDTIPSQRAIGVFGIGGRSYTSIGVFGGKNLGSFSPVNYAGIYGSTGTFPTFSTYPGIYAGYFKGKVRVTNGIYATVLSPTASASSSGQGEATILSDRGESVTDKLSQVQTVQFLRYDPTEEVGTRRDVSVPSDEEIDKMSPHQLDSLAATLGEEEPERYLSPVQYGLDADQLKAVYPELVYEDANGNVSINYVEMVPLLVQSINELKKELAELVGTRRGASASREQKAEATGIEGTVSDIDIVRMDQNNPNPFSESTVIALNIPAETQTATIFIYDMSGKQVQSLPVSERGETNITVYAADLTAGMYIYTLLIDGKVAVTRRMIVTI